MFPPRRPLITTRITLEKLRSCCSRCSIHLLVVLLPDQLYTSTAHLFDCLERHLHRCRTAKFSFKLSHAALRLAKAYRYTFCLVALTSNHCTAYILFPMHVSFCLYIKLIIFRHYSCSAAQLDIIYIDI